ncbi:phosphoadenosine phosphosulfate reductase domain-containing protein [Pseudonocardia humida]|nr:phosphoadenosine phosphosulfate reductase family protein [Pseudonocardia humida]
MLYSIGKDGSVLLHLARKAFHPSPPSRTTWGSTSVLSIP